MAPGTFDVPETDLGRVVLTAPKAFPSKHLRRNDTASPVAVDTPLFPECPIYITYWDRMNKMSPKLPEVLVLAEEGPIL
jgi:hypothetical protein